LLVSLLLAAAIAPPAYAEPEDAVATRSAMQITTARATVDAVSERDVRTRLQAQSDLAAAAFAADELLRHETSPTAQAVLESAQDIRRELGGVGQSNQPAQTPDDVLAGIPAQRAALQAAVELDDAEAALQIHGLLLQEKHDLREAFKHVPTPEADRVRAVVAQLDLDLGLLTSEGHAGVAVP
jgi:hypothetical protein